MEMTEQNVNINVYDVFSQWLKNDLHIERNYAANLKSLNKHLLSSVTGTDDFPTVLYNNVISCGNDFCLDAVCLMTMKLIDLSKGTTTLSEGYFNDCKSAFKQYYWFLVSIKRNLSSCIVATPAISSPDNIEMNQNPRSALNIDQRLKTQDRLNKDEAKPVNFPIRIIDQIANNINAWADKANLPLDHPARQVKAAKEKWLEDQIDKIVFLIEGHRQVVFSEIAAIGTASLPSGQKYVYIQINNGELHQVMTRTAVGNIQPMVLEPEDGLNKIALDHVYRMEDILLDLGAAFPFLKKLTEDVRKHNQGNIRGAETRKAVIDYIKSNFIQDYANEMGQLIKEFEMLSKICSLEAIYTKDNLEKH